MAKQTNFKRSENVAAMSVTWTDKFTGDSLTLGYHDVATKLQSRVSLYGLAKLVEDRTSAVDPDDKLDARRIVAQHLAAGQWSKDVVRGAPVVSPEIEALAEIKGCTVADVQRSRKRYSPEQWDLILENSGARAKAAEIRAAREATEVSFDDFLETDEGEEETEEEVDAELSMLLQNQAE